jgi:hypothetical protein
MEGWMSLKTALLGLVMLTVLHEAQPVSGASVTSTFDYSSTLNQILTSPSTGSGVFTEIGQATFSDPTLSAQFTATGTFSDSGLTAEFNTFNFGLYQDSKLVGLSTRLFSGDAHLTPTPITIFPLTGSFDVKAAFQPIGRPLSGYKTIDISGTVTAVPGSVPLGPYLVGLHTGSGTVTLQNPEPTTVLLLGSGMAGFAFIQYMQRRRAANRYQPSAENRR